ncbi:hypothetical protein I4U23_022779 [Adineta vaga]|nr:hypothetical protein I4U23_022779 [Adineta vaga]
MKQFPYAPSDSPQSKYYVELSLNSPPGTCRYGTFWIYGGFFYNKFPSHWLSNSTSISVMNYLPNNFTMIHSSDSLPDEDYWYSKETCRISSGKWYSCQEIYFKKNTDIPLRSIQVVRRSLNYSQVTTDYTIISIGKPDEKYFDSIPENWSTVCQDTNLGIEHHPTSTRILLNQSARIQILLTSPPHRINGNDTVIIQWKADICEDCLTWTPKRLVFNSKNFFEKQILTITRIKDSPKITFLPIFYGGGFDSLPSSSDPIFVS